MSFAIKERLNDNDNENNLFNRTNFVMNTF